MNLKPRKRIIKSVIIKEFKQMFRDKRMRVILFVPPIVMLLIFGYAVSTDVTDVGMALLDADRSAQSRSFIERFTSSGYFSVRYAVDSPKEADALLDSGRAEMFLHIENGFSRHIRQGKTGVAQILVDGTDSSRASVIVSYVNEVTSSFAQSHLADRVRSIIVRKDIRGTRFRENVELRERVMFNPSGSSRNFYLPGILGLLVSLVAISLTSMSIIREREVGTMEQIIVSPLRPIEFIAGKSLPYMIVCFTDITVIALITIFWFKVPFLGSFVFLLCSSLVFIFTSATVGLFISTVSRTQQQAMLSTFLFFLPSILLSGFIFPIYSMPESMQFVAYVNPMTYFINMVRGVFLKGTGMAYLWKDLLILFAMGAALFALSSKRFSEGME